MFHLNAKIVPILLNIWAIFVCQPAVRDELQYLKKKIKKKTGMSVECPQRHQFSHFPSLLNSDLFLKSGCFPSNNKIRRRTIEQPPYVFLVIILLAFMISNMRVRYHSNGFSYLFFLLQVTTRILGSNDRNRWYIQIWKISFGSEWKGDNFKIYHPYFRTCWERFEVNKPSIGYGSADRRTDRGCI